MDISLLEKIVKLMRANDLTTVEVEEGDKRILLKRGGEVIAMTSQAMPMASSPPAAAPSEAPAAEENLVPIKSIMVGTFYSASSPDAKPFVNVGTHVDEETDVCIIEAMKVFNTIKADCRGTIAKILANNGQAVEFGQPLFLVKPD
ncbi:MAG TPA: acetyl-CoA carboxylase biotin carboxyl carrier protein [Tepidisphaeraceae bacterium]|nr:acetyl-CoA carboxylase biotin carboxyl carrier protein [Tepidisphaeraceae bacterium]